MIDWIYDTREFEIETEWPYSWITAWTDSAINGCQAIQSDFTVFRDVIALLVQYDACGFYLLTLRPVPSP